MKNPIDILREQLPFPDDFDMHNGDLEFSIHHGYIKVEYRNSPEHGSSHFAGSYHPNDRCQGVGICVYCGRTLF